ncbi:MAG: type II secretion system minor pseudopilin GspK [Shimia sp.]|uniref:type II secretion system minor pseudopilin GspK n=1 Tax=Shimia sp. TaxID=1954381 RepID=UPI003B8E4AD9
MLVNALVLVAALSAVAIFLLARADAGREQLEAGLVATQVELNLDAFEALAKTLLERDLGAVDHTGEAWGQPVQQMPLMRGTVTGQVTDQQGLFNLNWLSNPEFGAAHEAFGRLMNQQSVPLQTAQRVRELIASDELSDPSPWARKTPSEAPVPGPLLMADQLAHVPGFAARHRDRIMDLVTALPGDSPLNVNTASEAVLKAFLPNLTAAAQNQILRDRAKTPFASVDEFLLAVGMSAPDSDDPGAPVPELLPDQLSVGSEWFRAEIATTVDTHSAQRSVMFHRQSLPVGVTADWRITTRP